MEQTDRYKTITGTAEGFYKEKGSRFIALAFHVETEEEAKEQLSAVKKKYHDARHHCYAFRIRPENEYYRSSDDGEPSGTAGKPILNRIFSAELFNILIVVVRYFGGTKLGVPGLIRAYKTAAGEAIRAAEKKTVTITRKLEISFEYPQINEVMRIVKEAKLQVVKQDFKMKCRMVLLTEKNQEQLIVEKLKRIKGLTLK